MLENIPPLILPINYFGPYSWFKQIVDNPVILYEQHENYQKRSPRNRCIILGPGGEISLSVPLRSGKNRRQPIKEVKIAYDEDWIKLHLRSLRNCYGNTAFFSHFYPEIEKLLSTKYEYLFDLNLETLKWVYRKLGFASPILLTGEFQGTKVLNQDSQILNYPCNFDAPKTREHLSILDLLFYMGPEAQAVLKQS